MSNDGYSLITHLPIVLYYATTVSNLTYVIDILFLGQQIFIFDAKKSGGLQ